MTVSSVEEAVLRVHRRAPKAILHVMGRDKPIIMEAARDGLQSH
jgi:hypothetical protein